VERISNIELRKKVSALRDQRQVAWSIYII
jgi:hypothetical protein